MTTQKLQFLLTAKDSASAAFAKVRGEIDAIKGSSAVLSSTLGRVAPALAAAFSVGAITSFIRSTVDGIDALNDLKDATGASIENLSALEDVAVRTGTSLDTAGAAVVKLNQALNTASDPNSGAAQALKALGLSVEELKRQDPVLALQQVGIALNRFADDGNKGRIILELLGRSAKDLAPLLKDLADAGKLNATVTTEQAEAAEQFNKELFALQKNATDIARTLAGPMVSAVNDTIAAFRKGAAEGKGFFATLRDEQLKLLGLGGGPASLDSMNQRMRELNSLLDTPRRLTLFSGQAGKLEAERRELKQQLELAAADAKSAFLRLDKDTSPAKRPTIGDVLGEKPTKPTKAKKPNVGKAETPEFVGPELPDALAAALKRLEQSDEAKLARLRAELQQLASIAQGGGQVPDSVFAQLADDIAKLDPAGRAASAAIEKLAEDQKRLQDILGNTPTGKMQALLQEIEFINAQFSAGNIQSAEQWAEAVRTATGTMDNDVNQSLEKNADAARELGLTFSSAFEDAIVGGSDFRDVLDGLEQDLLRIGTRKLITEPLTDVVSGLFSSTGGAGGIGSVLGSLFSGAFADGGFVPPGRWGIAGEQGPEPVFGGRTGVTVQPAGGGRSVTVNNTFVLPSGGYSRATQQQIAAAAARSVQIAGARSN